MLFKVCPYLLSQYLWVIIFGLVSLVLIPRKSKQISKDFFSSNSIYQLDSPAIYMHIADLNINANDNKTYLEVKSKLSKAIKKFKPEVLFATGNLIGKTDGIVHTKKVDKLKKDSWELLIKLIEELKKIHDFEFLPSFGPNDISDTYAFSSQSNYVEKLNITLDNFFQNRIVKNYQTTKIALVAINPYVFPIGPVNFNEVAYPDKKVKLEIKEALSGDEEYIISSGHHRVYDWYPDELHNILKQGKNRLYLSGHTSQGEPKFIHHGDCIEVLPEPIQKNWNVGIISVDNSAVVYHTVPIDEENTVIITHPPPIAQPSGLDSFDQYYTTIRAVAFTEKSLSLSMKLQSSNISLIKDPKSLNENIYQYKSEISVSDGIWEIEKEGDWSGTLKFGVESSFEGMEENLYLKYATWEYELIFVVTFCFVLFLTIPLNFLGSIDKISDWINGRSNESAWTIATIGGFMAVKHRLNGIDRPLRWVLFAGTIGSIVLPLTFFEADGTVAFIWAYGFVCQGKPVFNLSGIQFALFYLIFVILPACLLASSAAGTHFVKRAFAVDIAFFIAMLGGLVYALYESIRVLGFPYGFFSLAFIVYPIVLWIFLIRFIIRKSKEIKITRAEEMITNPIDSIMA